MATENAHPERKSTFWVWTALVTLTVIPIIIAANSPLLAWREPIYIAAGFGGIVAMSLLAIQPLLISGKLPHFEGLRGRKLHRWIGLTLTISVMIHIIGLWITSPPDVVDALLFRSPTPFSIWGVVAMWALFASALLVAFRRKVKLKVRVWKLIHTALAFIIVLGSIVHALLIEGTMGLISKVLICALAAIATLWAIFRSHAKARTL